MKFAGRFLGLFEHLNLNGGDCTLQVELIPDNKNFRPRHPGRAADGGGAGMRVTGRCDPPSTRLSFAPPENN